MSGPYLHAVKLTIHSWELPSFPLEHLRSNTAAALRLAVNHFYPDCRMVEIAYNAEADSPVLDPSTGKRSAKGIKMECDIRGAHGERELHMLQHRYANELEGVIRRTLQIFIEADAKNRFRQMQAGYKHYSDVDEPTPMRNPVLT